MQSLKKQFNNQERVESNQIINEMRQCYNNDVIFYYMIK